MRLSATLGRIGNQWQLIGNPGSNLDEQRKLVHQIITDDGKHDGKQLDEIVLMTTSGLVKQKKFRKDVPSEVKAPVVPEEVAAPTIEEEPENPFEATDEMTPPPKAKASKKEQRK